MRFSDTPYRTLVLWHLRTSDDELRVAEAVAAEGSATEETHYYFGMRALADRDFNAATQHFERAREINPENPFPLYYLLYSLCMTDRCDAAAQIAKSLDDDRSQYALDPGYWLWMARTFDRRSPKTLGT